MAKKEAIFKVGVDSGNSVEAVKKLDKSFEKLDKTATKTKKTMSDTSGIDKFETELKELDALIDSGTLDMRQMTKVIQDYQTIAFKAGANSPVGAKAINQASALKDRITDLNNRVKQGASDYAKMDAALQGAGAAMAGFQAFQGVAALMGDENEELVKTIVKLQAGMSVLNSIQVLRNALNKDSAVIQQLQALQMKVRTKETYAQITAQKIANTVLKEGTKASKLFSKALIATGIGALVAGIGLLIANWDKLKASLSSTTKAQKLANDTMSKAIESAAEELNALDKLKDTINDENVSRGDKSKAIKELQAQYPSLLSNVDAEASSLEDVNRALELNAQLTLLKAQQDAIAELRVEEFKKQIQAQTNAQTGANQSFTDWAISLGNAELAEKTHIATQGEAIKQTEEQISALDELNAGIDEQIKALKEAGASDDDINRKEGSLASNRKTWADERKKQLEEQAAAERLYTQQRNETLDLIAEAEEAFLTSETDKQLNAINDRYFELITKAEEYGQDTTVLRQAQAAEVSAVEETIRNQELAELDAFNKMRLDANRQYEDLVIQNKQEGIDKDIELLNTKYQRELEAVATNETLNAEEKMLITQELEIAQQQAIEKVRDDYRKREEEKDAEAQQKKIDNFNNYTGAISQGLDSIASLSNSLTDIQLANAEGNDAKQEQIQRKAFERNKKIQIGMATISMIQGIVNALTAQSVIPEPFGTILKGINAVAVGAAGVANIAKIKSQKYQGGGGGGGASIPRGGGGVGAGAGALNIADTSSAQTLLNQDGTQTGSNTNSEDKPMKVYVTETDITKTQNDVNKINVRSTF